MDLRVLKDIEPKNLFKYFEDITRIPRGSGNEKAISDYLVNFAKDHNLEFVRDEALNVIIRKKGTKGYENSPGVILQGHMDMVCEKNKDTKHDFYNDPIKLIVEGDKIKTEGTTLGADNGIAIAMALAILDSKDIEHPPIELLATVGEETGMIGANALDPKQIKSKLLINIDSEEEGKLLVSCAGGARAKVILDKEEVDSRGEFLGIYVGGLKGGHSGMEIHKRRGNSNKIMGRILNSFKEEFPFNIVFINGGAKSNAIPREAEAVLCVDKGHLEVVNKKVDEWNSILKEEFRVSDSEVWVKVEKLESKEGKVLSSTCTKKIIRILNLLPDGVNTMSMDIKGLVESSSNLGVVGTKENTIEFESTIRSSVGSLKKYLINITRDIVELNEGKLELFGQYPEWKYNPNSYLKNIFKNTYEEMYGKEPEVTAIHAGLECGLFTEKFKDVDMISFGPDMYDVHTPNENLSISSVERTFEYLLAVLKKIK